MNFEKKTNVYRIVMLVIVTAMITFLVTSIGFYNYYVKSENGNIKLISNYIKFSESTQELTSKLELVKKYLEQSYMGELDEESMVEGAIKGYVEGLGDSYTEYLTESELEELMIDIEGDYVGIGVYITSTTNNQTVILLPIEGSPAEKAGLKSGDIILEIEGEDCSLLELDEVSNKIKGEKGTKVNLKILRGEKTIDFSIERKQVELKYITSEVLEKDIGYIQLLTFYENCTEDFKKELENLEEKNIKSLIIDLRDNGGGIVKDAIEMAELFVPKGNIIMKTYDKEGNETIEKSKSTKTLDMDIIILVNENSASATEIFTAALKENNIAKVIGTTTFGKGVMQEVQPISIGGAMKITVEKFKTPKGNEINEVGIVPDIEIEGTEEQLQKAIDNLK